MPTIRDVARACKVSPMTVSYVLNDKSGQVSAETRERVLKVVRELGYRPTAIDPAPTERTIYTLGIVVGIPGHSLFQFGYYSAIVNGILLTTDQLQHNITIFSSSLMHTDTQRSLRVYCDGRCDGLLVIAPHRGSKLVAALQERGIPFVNIGDTGDSEAISCVDVDNIAAGYAITEYLIRQGHRRIGFLGGPDFVRSAFHRQVGYHNALKAHGMPIDSSLESVPLLAERLAYERVMEIMQRPKDSRPTAFFCWNDNAVQHALRALHDVGLQVPKDVSLIGFDDHPDTATLDPPVTSVRQPYQEIATRAVEILLARIRGEQTQHRAFLPTELIVRESVGPPPPE